MSMKSWLVLEVLILVFFSSCSERVSNITGSKFNEPSNGGFEKPKFQEQETGPGLVLVEGGYFSSKENEEVLVSSFYMDITEVTNHNWCEYLYWTKRVFVDYPLVYENVLPNELVWQENGVYNDPKVENYLRHPAYINYPVVGISWLQANNFCAWRTDRVNENILIREGILLENPNQQNEPFTTGAYLAGQYEQGLNYKKQIINYDPSAASGRKKKDLGTRAVRIEDGILLPKYRLPTTVEWDYAAKSNFHKNKVLPWIGNVHKNYNDKNFIGNLVQGKISLLYPVDTYWPNDYGLYNMQGNVSEWTLDSYVTDKINKAYNSYEGEDNLKINTLMHNMWIADKLDFVEYNVEGIRDFIIELKNGRDMDTLDRYLFQLVESNIEKALNLGSLSRDKNILIELTLNEVIPGFIQEVQSKFGFESYESELVPLIRKGIAQFIISTPGNLRYKKTSK